MSQTSEGVLEHVGYHHCNRRDDLLCSYIIRIVSYDYALVRRLWLRMCYYLVLDQHSKKTFAQVRPWQTDRTEDHNSTSSRPYVSFACRTSLDLAQIVVWLDAATGLNEGQ